MGRFLVLVFLANLVLLILSVADCLGGEREPRRLRRSTWVLLILLFPIVGAIMWFVTGRPRSESTGRKPSVGGQTWLPGNRPSRPSTAPDDDPDFLRDLERRLREDNDDR